MTQELKPTDWVDHQRRVAAWMLECFGPDITADKVERADRFIEEALELAQATGWTADRGHALVDYVFGRPVGMLGQEVGGVMVTLAALCNVFEVDIEAEAKREVDRITQPEVVLKIRAKQAAKPTGSALPVAAAPRPSTDADSAGAVIAGLFGEWLAAHATPKQMDSYNSFYERRIRPALVASPPPAGEPVAWTSAAMLEAMRLPDTICGSIWPKAGQIASIPLYAQPPAPVVTDDMVERLARDMAIDDLNLGGDAKGVQDSVLDGQWRNYARQARRYLTAALTTKAAQP